MPIRVRALYTRYPHLGSYSGINQLVRHLDPAEYTVRLYGASDSDADLPLPHRGLERWLRERVQRRGMAWYKLSDLAAEIRALPGCVLGRIDIVHFLDAEHSAQYLPAALRRCRLSRARTVATYHQPPELLGGLINEDVVATLDYVTVVSPEQLDYFRGFLPANRVEMILHGIDTAFFRPGTGSREGRIFRCITAGHWLRDWDAVRSVAAALASCRAIEFHVVTDRPTGLDDLANVTVHRNVDDAELVSLYQRSDVLFLPLTQSTANNSLMEGIACGLPVVSTKLRSVRAYVSEAEAILVERNDPSQLADAIVHLWRNPATRTAMGRCARARAEELSWVNMAREYQRIYAGLAACTTRR
jgi:glycosyltransferase involved in cell wall biosynthesis